LFYTSIQLTFAWSVFFLIVIVGLSVGLSAWLYRETIPPVSQVRRRILISLRSAAFAIAFFILFEPILDLQYEEKEKPVVAVLIDASESMSIRDAQGDRQQQRRGVLDHRMWADHADAWDIRYFTFSDRLYPSDHKPSDTLALTGHATDMRTALEQTQSLFIGKHLAAYVMITDGQYNIGGDPGGFAQVSDVPVFTLGIGDPAESRDVAIVQISHNETAYLGATIPVTVTLSSYGYQGKRIDVEILHNGKRVQNKIVVLPEDGALTQVTMDVIPDEIGDQKYTVRASPLLGELSDRNNQRAFVIRVLKNKTSVTLISGAPGPDHRFIYSVLIENPNLDVRAYVEQKNGTLTELEQPPGRTSPTEADVYIFNDYPTNTSDPSTLQRFLQDISDNNRSAAIFFGNHIEVGRLQSIQSRLPIKAKPDASLQESSVFIGMSGSASQSTIVAVSDDPGETMRQWADLPPVWISRYAVTASEESDVLARVDMSRTTNTLRLRNDIPLLITKRLRQQKTLAFTGYGFWKADFIIKGLNKSNAVYPAFIQQSVQWLAAKDDTKPVIVRAGKSVYRSGEAVMLTTQVYDEQFRPISDANVNVTLQNGSASHMHAMQPLGNGRYEITLDGLMPGDYPITSSAERFGALIGTDKTAVTVEAFSLEMSSTAMNARTLQTIASASGGRFFASSGIDSLAGVMNFQPLIFEREKNIPVWNATALLILIILLLSAEWWIRKRSDML